MLTQSKGNILLLSEIRCIVFLIEITVESILEEKITFWKCTIVCSLLIHWNIWNAIFFEEYLFAILFALSKNIENEKLQTTISSPVPGHEPFVILSNKSRKSRLVTNWQAVVRRAPIISFDDGTTIWAWSHG